MTTIAWDGKTLAGDRQVTMNNYTFTYMPKVYKRKDGALMGFIGEPCTASAYMRWFMKGEKGKAPSLKPVGEKTDSVDLMIVRKDGSVELYDENGWHRGYGPIAMGSGSKFARMAMRLGKTAEEAVQLASEFDVYTSYETDTVTL